MAGSQAKKRVVSLLPDEDDGRASEDAGASPSQGTRSSLEAPETITRYRAMSKVQRSVSEPFSGPCPHAEICLASPFTALDAFPLSSSPKELAVPRSAYSFGCGERLIFMPDVSASRRDVRDQNFTQGSGKLRNDRNEPEETCERNSDGDVEGTVSKDKKAHSFGIEVVNENEGAMHETEDRLLAIEPATKLAARSVNKPPDDENFRKPHPDWKGRKAGFFGIEGVNANQGAIHEERRVVAIKPAARSVKNPLNDENTRKLQGDGEGEQITTDRKDQVVDYQPAQSCTSVTKGTEDSSSDKTAVTSSSFSFGTVPLSFGTPTGFELFRSTSSRWSSRSNFGLEALVKGNLSSPSTSFQNNNASIFQSYSSQPGSLGSDAGVSPRAQTTAESLQSQVFVETEDKLVKVVFVADATLFEYVDGSWTKCGDGELKLIVPGDVGGDSTLLMKSKRNSGLLLNALFPPDTQVISMDNLTVTFVCVNSAVEGNNILTTYAVRLKDSLTVTGFIEAVETCKGNIHSGLKTSKVL